MNSMEKGKKLLLSPDKLFHEKYFLANPVSGRDSMKSFEKAKKVLKGTEFQYYVTKGRGDGARFLSEKLAAAERANKILFVVGLGGDGFLNELINANGDLSRLILAPVPKGHGNDFFRSLNRTNEINADITYEQFNKIFSGKASLEDYVQCIDLIKATYDDGKEVKANYLFSLGFDGVVCKEVNSSRRKGGFREKNIYITKTIQVIRKNQYEPIKIKYSLNNDPATAKEADNILMFTIMNGRYAGSGINYNPEYSLDDGLLEGFLIKNQTGRDISKLLWNVRVTKDNAHITAEKDADGFNRFKINYMKGIRTASISIMSANQSTQSGQTNQPNQQENYINTDGEPHLVEKPDLPIKVEVLKAATTMFYMPEK